MLYTEYLKKLALVDKYNTVDAEGFAKVLQDTGDVLAIYPEFDKMSAIMFAVAKNDYKGIRQAMNYSVATFSDALGIPPTTLYNWERGERTSPLYVIQFVGFILVRQLMEV